MYGGLDIWCLNIRINEHWWGRPVKRCSPFTLKQRTVHSSENGGAGPYRTPAHNPITVCSLIRNLLYFVFVVKKTWIDIVFYLKMRPKFSEIMKFDYEFKTQLNRICSRSQFLRPGLCRPGSWFILFLYDVAVVGQVLVHDLRSLLLKLIKKLNFS